MDSTGMVTVCSECKMACCWKGVFMCDEARNASTIELTVSELKRLDREHSDYWDGTYERSHDQEMEQDNG